MTFGSVLREARERKGYDLATAARRLRIRPDILRAIEEDDFSRMPPRGYTRNMVNAYARLLGLNPTEITRMYLDEAYAYQVGRARTHAEPSRFDMGSSSRNRRTRERQQPQQEERPPRQNAFGRTLYDDRTDYSRSGGGAAGGGVAGRRSFDERTHPSRHAALPNTQYTNFYAGPKAPGAVQSKLPLIIAGAVVLVLLIVILVLVFGNKGPSSTDDVPSVPITGLTDTTQTGEGSSEDQQPVVPKETAPTSVAVEYKIAKDTAVWAIMTKNGEESNQTFSGGESDTVELTAGDVWTFATWVSDKVSITVAGEKVSFDSTNDEGMPLCTVSFDDYLAKWKEAHPDAAASGSSGTAATGGSSASGTSSGSGSAS